LRCGIADGQGELTSVERMRLRGDADSRGASVWHEIIEAISVYAARTAPLVSADAPIAFAFPGPVLRGRIPTAAPTVRGGPASLPDISGILAARTQREVLLVNDVSAAAWYFSERTRARRFAVVTVSSGIGAKIFDRAHPLGVFDDVPYAGELGHTVVDAAPDAVMCDCGGRGHLGAIASARGIERGARLRAREDPETFARSACALFGATADSLTNEAHLVPSIRAGDRWATELLRRSLVPLSRTLETLAVGCGLDEVILMGGFVQQLGDVYRCALRDILAGLGSRGPAKLDLDNLLRIVQPHDEPSLAGAAAYARLTRAVR
jgi:predicted NBD/HSP70 family sugar kinase